MTDLKDELTQVPDEYKDTIAEFLIQYTEHCDALHRPSPYQMSNRLHVTAQAAVGIPHRHQVNAEYVITAVDDIVRALFSSPVPKYPDFEQAPAPFWDTPLGMMCARALLWAYQGDLVTLQEAADLARVSVQAISQAVEAGRLTRFVDPDAPERQRHTLVLKREVTDEIAWKRRLSYPKSNRYRKPEKRQAYEAALDDAEQADDLGYPTYVSLRIRAEDAGLNPRDAKDVAAKAIRVERHTRMVQRVERQYALATTLASEIEDENLNSPTALETLTQQLVAAQVDPDKARILAGQALNARRYQNPNQGESE